jgi:AmmeMemoRadiSam system protein B
VEDLLAHSKVKHGSGRICALIVPHAGYVYSGPVAAEAFALLRTENQHAGRVVVIGPAHRMLIQGIAVSSAGAFATPLGKIPLDTAEIAEIANFPSVVVDNEPHANEHALVELPFLQTVLGSIRIVPLLVGLAAPIEVAEVLSRLWDDDTLIVVSSDLSHYLRYENARRRDCATAEAVFEPGSQRTFVERVAHEVCGTFNVAPDVNGVPKIVPSRSESRCGDSNRPE